VEETSLPDVLCEAKTFFLEGGEVRLAISKERKEELVSQYREWADGSRAMVLTDYLGLTMKDLDELRQKVREVGGEYHIVKNTLTQIAFEEQGLPLPEGYFEGTTAIGFAFEDAPGLAKALSEFAKSSDFLKIKGGYLGENFVSAEQINALADLPPMPVMRAQLLGTLMAPARQLVRTLAEPGRQIAQIIKAYADREEAPDAVNESA
jgi:large subunit ribosomal protein L10